MLNGKVCGLVSSNKKVIYARHGLFEKSVTAVIKKD